MGSIVRVVEGMDWRIMEAGGQDDTAQVQHGPLEPQEGDLVRQVLELERHQRVLEREEVDLLSQDIHIEGEDVDMDRQDEYLGPVGGDLARLDDDYTGAVRGVSHRCRHLQKARREDPEVRLRRDTSVQDGGRRQAGSVPA
jgi:hypothetical protein